MTEYRPPIDPETQAVLESVPFQQFGEIQPLAEALDSLQRDLDHGKDVKALHVGSEKQLAEMKRRKEQSLRDRRRSR